MKLKLYCPHCGELIPNKLDMAKKKAIKILYKKGFGVRQLQRMFNYKSPQSISFIVRSER